MVRGAWGTSVGLPSWSLPHISHGTLFGCNPQVFRHPKYDEATSDNAIPLLKLGLYASYLQTLSAVCLRSASANFAACTLCHHGHTSERLARHGVGGQQGHRQGMLC